MAGPIGKRDDRIVGAGTSGALDEATAATVYANHRAVAVVGTQATTVAGVVVTGSATVFAERRAVARSGDDATTGAGPGKVVAQGTVIAGK